MWATVFGLEGVGVVFLTTLGRGLYALLGFFACIALLACDEVLFSLMVWPIFKALGFTPGLAAERAANVMLFFLAIP